MSDQHFDYPLNHRVFSGGRYLRAFDHLHDIDHFEHSILTYLGSLMPFDKGFIDLPAFPSVATIARSTKISESTVRKKVKALETKGYLKVKAVRLINSQGRFQQSSNDYLLSKIAFAFFDEVLGTHQHIHQLRKRAVGESFTYAPTQPSPTSLPVGSYLAETDPIVQTVPKSLPKIQTEDPDRPDSSCPLRDKFTRKAEVDRIERAWLDVVKKPVSKAEKEKFLREYLHADFHEIYFMERILRLIHDPYLLSRAKSINFLFGGFDAAIKNLKEIQKTATRVLNRVESKSQLDDVLQQLPTFIDERSNNYADVSRKLIQHLLHKPIQAASTRVSVSEPLILPSNDRELRAAIEERIRASNSEEAKERLRTILLAVSRTSFETCLKLYVKHVRET